jgi:hypothetical protein
MRRQQRRLELEMKRKERVGDKSSSVVESKSDKTCASGKISVFVDVEFLLLDKQFSFCFIIETNNWLMADGDIEKGQ